MISIISGAVLLWGYLIILNIIFFIIFILFLFFWAMVIEDIDVEIYEAFADSYLTLRDYGVENNLINPTPLAIIFGIILPGYSIIKISEFIFNTLAYGLNGAANISSINQMRQLDLATANKEEMLALFELDIIPDEELDTKEKKDIDARD